MTKNTNIPTNAELPSMGQLLKSTVLAICIAALLLVTVVLPAEYGLDPTGVGNMLGLVKMGQIKVSLEQEAADDRNNAKAEKSKVVAEIETVREPVPTETAVATPDIRSDEMTITLAPDEGKEIKLMMAKDATVNYSWWTSGGKANFDAHADSKALKISYHSYRKGSMERNEGVMEAAFDGNHGWFWRNRTAEPMTVTLKVSGAYSEVIRY
jgi:hypothetical protein